MRPVDMLDSIKSLPKRFFSLTRSIRFRLALWFVLTLGLVVVSFSSFIYVRQAQDLRSTALGRLDPKTRRLGGFSRFFSEDYFQQTPLRFPSDPVTGEPLLQEGDVLAFIAPDGQVIQNWGPIDANGVNQLVGEILEGVNSGRDISKSGISVTLSGEKSRNQYIFMVAPISFGNRLAGFFLIGNPVDPGEQLPRLLVSLILGTLFTLAVALGGGFWLADRAMQPVKIITQTARTIGETDLSLRIHSDRKDELGELANTFDDMLTRLQAAFERQRQFTADASHELRTPLTIVELEASRALAAQRSIQEYESALKVIQSENQFMTHMVINLLTLARMDAGQVVLQKEELDLSDIALEVVERLAPLAVKSQVKLSAGELPELLINGDRQYMVQMLTNLVENGIKYTTGEDKHIWVEAGSRSSEEGLQAWVRITDNGPGISTEHLPHLFDRFYQVDKARTRQSGDKETPSGIGLGLSIAQWIAQAHGGEIRVESEVGKGSTFEASFPLVTSKSDMALPDSTG